jgi:lysozyme
MRCAWCIIMICLGSALLSLSAREQEKKTLSDDVSRDALGIYAASLQTGVRVLSYRFKFAQNVESNRVFGIDVSHYNGNLKWDRVAEHRISFVYVKASQGTGYYDGNFAANWKLLGEVRSQHPMIRRGAYHFMTAADSRDLQAQNFLTKVGHVNTDDMPPCLDLEWDFLIKNKTFVLDAQGRRIDQWATFKSPEIVNRIKVWLQKVEAATGRRPIIYTTVNWWSERVGARTGFDAYPFWIADYCAKSLGQEEPATPPSFSWSMWQLTDKGSFRDGNSDKTVDTTVYKGSPDTLAQEFGVTSASGH